MINELKLQLNRFIESCDNELLRNEALEILTCKTWWTSAIKNTNNSFGLIRTEKIFTDYRENSILSNEI